MPEMLPHFDLEGQRLPDISRDDYYDKARRELRETGRVSTAIGSLWVGLVHPEKGMMLQLRAADKLINPSVWDTTMGHIQAHETAQEACARECEEELGIKVTMVPRITLGAYKGAAESAQEAFVAHLSTEMTMVPKVLAGIGVADMPVMLSKFFGYYCGDFDLKDQEAVATRYITIKELRDAVRQMPELFPPYGEQLVKLWEEGRQGMLEAAHYRVSLKALITDEVGRLLLLKHRIGTFDLPGGGLEHGEAAADCIVREVAEETGLCVTAVDENPYCLVTFAGNKYGQVANVMYRAICPISEIVPSEECMEVRFVTLEEIEAMPEHLMKGNLLQLRQIWRQRGTL